MGRNPQLEDTIFCLNKVYILPKEAFFNYVDKILSFFDHLAPNVDIFYLIRVDKVNIFKLPTHLFLST